MPLAPVRISNLKRMALSPAHYECAVNQESYAKERGGALHSMILGGKEAIAYPGAVRRGKEFDAFVASNPGKLVLTKSDYGKAMWMADAVRNNRDAMTLLTGEREVEINWAFMGRACQSHIDCLGGGFVTDLKSAASSHPDKMAWQSLRLGYGAQLAFYQEAAKSMQVHVPDAYVVAVESRLPHVVTVMKLTEKALEQGRKAWRLWFERLLLCEAEGYWPGYVQGIVPLDVPDEEVDLIFPDDGGEEEAA